MVTEYVRLHEMQGATVVIMALAGEVVAAFAIKDPIKPEASAVVKALKKAGIKARSVAFGLHLVLYLDLSKRYQVFVNLCT